MKKLLLTAIGGLLCLGSAAAPPYARTTEGLRSKRINTTEHLRREAPAHPAAMRSPLAAPANALEVPFSHSLGKNSTGIADYTVIDANEDGIPWKPGGFTTYTVIMKSKTLPTNDDWLISPPVHLLAGQTYTLKLQAGSALAAGGEETLEIKAGTEATVEGMTLEIVPVMTTPKNGNKYNDIEQDFTVPAEGYYHIGFHALSEVAKSGNLRICNFSIETAGDKVDPPAAGTLSYTLAPKGELKATVTYVAPDKTVSGATLEKITKVEVKTNWVVTHTFTDIAPGKTKVFDTELYNNNYNKIEITAYVDDTPGETVKVENFYAGPDNPLPVENVKAVLSDDYKSVTLSWDAVGETGEKGGYVDTDKVVYYIFDAFGSYYDPALATTDKTSITFDYSEAKEQDFVAFQVTAGVDELFYSLETNSGIVVVGQPETLPFTESFTDAYFAQMWAIDPATTSSGVMCGTLYDNELQTNADDPDAEPQYLNSHDADNGFFFFMPMEPDALYGFFSTKIDVSKTAKPVLEFYYQGKGSALDALIAKDGGDFEVARTIDLRQEATDDWTLCRIDLAPYKSAKYIQMELRFRAIHNTDDTMWSVPLDNIRIRDLADTDLRVSYLKAPEKADAGSPTTVTVSLENMGNAAAKGAEVTLAADGKVFETKTVPELAAGGVATVDFVYTPGILAADKVTLTARASLAGDANADNDVAETSMAVVHSVLPAPTGLTAEYSLNYEPFGSGPTYVPETQLDWTSPDFDALTKTATVTEDFESETYTPLTIHNFGGWTLMDVDKDRTYNILHETANPYQTQPQAFQLYNPEKAGVPAEYMIDAQAHSGKQFLVAWSAQSKQNDNWLISPELSGEAQTISFFAKSFTIAFAESFEVLYSTSGKDIESFVRIEDVENYPADNQVPEEWTEFKAALPAGAKHFAIRHTAYDTYALYVDDITYEAAPVLPADLAITGFNVYCQGETIGSVVEAPSYLHQYSIDAYELGSTLRYHVTAVYNHGESRAAAPAEVELPIELPVSLDTTAAPTVAVRAVTGGIAVSGAEGLSVNVATTDGRLLHSSTATAEVFIPAATGIYVVSAGDSVVKVAVK